MNTYECRICGWIYDESKGSPEEGLSPGTRWEDIPDDWCCPVCGAAKGDFDMVVIELAPADAEPVTASSTTRPLVILGTGLAGYTLAREFRKFDSSTPLFMVTRDSGGFYAKPSLSNALANYKTPAQLQTRTAEQMAAELRAEIQVREEVVSITPSAREINLASGEKLSYDRLVLAWGADPIHLSYEGDGTGAVKSVNDLDDFSVFFSGLATSRSVLVIGAGLIGCEFANDLASRQIKTSLVDPAGWPLSRLLPEEAGLTFRNRLENSGVDFYFGTSVKGIWRKNSQYRIELTDGRQIMADQILSAIGLRPRTAIAQAAGIACQRGIVANRLLESSTPDIYAIGDCVEIAGLNLPFVSPIMHQAAALAKTLAGTPTALSYPAMPVTVKTPACPAVVCPPPMGASGTWRCEAVDDGLQALFRSPAGMLLGFALLGSATSQSQALANQLPAMLS